MLQLNETHLFLYGGFLPPGRNLRRTWTLDLSAGEERARWVERRPSAVGRRKAFAGLVDINEEKVRA